ncbi:hypothetical protein BCR36DRAFT_177729 [Piromyces finnis]|uniref:Uncharacterized protein n=1 Tax=Piromyces finnis TaxID=1754191 RepID=A0A1Y1VJ41_9FUNG|nr:hypothetical protein BCR36DRAFT_177729 [Piromyces finnis]|eukprot:ORX56112.1 hypothetical protein BCR36DRAFT_177729 [Piromyces finnis]
MVDSVESLNLNKRKNCRSEYIEPAMMKQNSLGSLLLRSKTLPIKNNEKIKKNLLKEYKHEIKMEEKKERKMLIEEENFCNDNGWLSGPAGLQMINESNNIQTNNRSDQQRRRTLQVPEYHTRHHSLSLPLSQDKCDYTDKKRYRRKSALSQDKEYNKDCIVS